MSQVTAYLLAFVMGNEQFSFDSAGGGRMVSPNQCPLQSLWELQAVHIVEDVVCGGKNVSSSGDEWKGLIRNVDSSQRTY